MKLPVRNAEGKQVRQVDVDESIFGIEPNAAVLHQAFVAQRANQRWGTAQTKSRGEVQGSARKIRNQKYTGRARQGSARAPHRVGGGVAFGPRRRDYSQALPKKMRRLAIRSALSGKVAHGQLVVIDKLALERPKTQEVLRILRNVGIERSALIVTGQPEGTALHSTRNLAKTKVLPAAYLNVVDMLTHRDLLMTVEAVRVAEGLWGQKVAAAPAPMAEPKRRRAAKPQAAAAEKPAPEVESPAAARALPRPQGRRPAAAAAEPVVETKPKRRPRLPAPEVAAKALPRPKARRPAAATAEPVVEAKPKRRPRLPVPEAAAPPAEEPKPARRPAAATAEPVVEAKPKRRPRAPAPEAAAPPAEEPKPARPSERRRARGAAPQEGEEA